MSILTAKQKSLSRIDIFRKLYQIFKVLPVTGLFNYFFNGFELSLNV